MRGMNMELGFFLCMNEFLDLAAIISSLEGPKSRHEDPCSWSKGLGWAFAATPPGLPHGLPTVCCPMLSRCSCSLTQMDSAPQQLWQTSNFGRFQTQEVNLAWVLLGNCIGSCACFFFPKAGWRGICGGPMVGLVFWEWFLVRFSTYSGNLFSGMSSPSSSRWLLLPWKLWLQTAWTNALLRAG